VSVAGANQTNVRTEPCVFDAIDLRALFADDRDSYAQLLADFERTVDECADAIVAAAEACDLARVRARGHELKGVAGNVGAHELAEWSRNMEDAAKRGAHAELEAALPAFKEARARCRRAVAAEIALSRTFVSLT